MKLIVTGATGFIGRRLVERLISEDHSVTAFTRDPQTARKLLPVKCEVVRWNANSVPPEAIEGFDAIVNLAGAGVADKRWTESRKNEIRESRVGGTRALVAAMALLPEESRPDTLISASAIGYYGDRESKALDESAESGKGFLAGVCREWEREALAADALGVRTALVRIGVVLGKDGGALAQMLPLFRLGLGGRLGSGRQWMSWIHIDDIVSLLMFTILNRDAKGPINAVAPAPVRNQIFTAELAGALKKLAILPVPGLGLRVAMGEMASMLLASQRVLPTVAEKLGFQFRFPLLDEALAHICSDLDHELKTEQWFPLPPEKVFSFFSDAGNLERITPDFLGFKIKRLSTAKIEEGTVIDYRLSLHGLPLRWQSVIDDWSPGRRFIDSQRRGPYASWHHTHEFEAHNGGTLVRDKIRYSLPMAPLGDVVAGTFVANDLDKVFEFRRHRLSDLLA